MDSGVVGFRTLLGSRPAAKNNYFAPAHSGSTPSVGAIFKKIKIAKTTQELKE
jgi:hypothetical protein